jgi:hypothetical protein
MLIFVTMRALVLQNRKTSIFNDYLDYKEPHRCGSFDCEKLMINQKKLAIEFFVTLFLSIFLTGCKSDLPIDKPIIEPETGYPPPTAEQDISPQNLGETYPVETVELVEVPGFERGPDFNIEEPVSSGENVVSGNGPAEVPIILVDVSTGGTILGQTTIKEDGNFLFDLDQPLESGHSIGLKLGDISNTDLNPDDFIYNENYYDRPYVGILFDMIVVE